MTVPMFETLINGNWTISLPAHRAHRAEWQTGWERERLDSMYANLRPGDVVFDVGTEEGDLSALYAQWVDGWTERGGEYVAGGVVMFEPNTLVWPNVRAIWEANDLPDPLGWVIGFASDRDAPGVHSESPRSWDAGSRTWPQSAYGPVIADHGFKSLVESEQSLCNVRLDSVANAVARPTALTLDCEGSELRVLQGATEILQRDRPLVWISVHVMMIQYDYGATAEDVHRYMADRDYRMHQLAMDHECHWVYVPIERTDFIWPWEYDK